MKKFFSLVLALAMALSMASFASAEETTTIHIGVIGPMTGADAVYGLAVARGAEIAVEEINAAGKVNIVLDVQDDENDAEKSINAYNATLDKGTQVILGCVTTTPCIAVSAQAYDERVYAHAFRLLAGSHREQGQRVSGLLHGPGTGLRVR